MKSNLLLVFFLSVNLLLGQTFTAAIPMAPFEGVSAGSIAFADVDGDTDQDVLITGWDNTFNGHADLFINNGSGIFTEVTGTGIKGVFASLIAFSDIDGDTDQDLLITEGQSAGTSIAILYTNNGLGNFTEVIGTLYTNVSLGSIAFADVHSDMDIDLLITGSNYVNNAYSYIAKLQMVYEKVLKSFSIDN